MYIAFSHVALFINQLIMQYISQPETPPSRHHLALGIKQIKNKQSAMVQQCFETIYTNRTINSPGFMGKNRYRRLYE